VEASDGPLPGTSSRIVTLVAMGPLPTSRVSGISRSLYALSVVRHKILNDPTNGKTLKSIAGGLGAKVVGEVPDTRGGALRSGQGRKGPVRPPGPHRNSIWRPGQISVWPPMIGRRAEIETRLDRLIRAIEILKDEGKRSWARGQSPSRL